MELLDKITAAILNLIAHREVLAIALGLVISLCGTQMVKVQFPDKLNRLRVNLLAVPLGFIPTYLIFPEAYGYELRVTFALAVGVSAPYVYKIAMWAIGKANPELAARFSADL